MTKTCFVCKREALHGLTYRGRDICPLCSPNAPSGFVLREFYASHTETRALDAGGAAGGAYLDEIGNTDLATLNEEQWVTFLAKILEGYSGAMQHAAATEPPF